MEIVPESKRRYLVGSLGISFINRTLKNSFIQRTYTRRLGNLPLEHQRL